MRHMPYLILIAALASACTPLTQVEEITEQNALAPRVLQTLLLIGVTGDDATRRRYENRCQDSFSAVSGSSAARIISSHEIFPDGSGLTRESVIGWLNSNDQVDGILVMQLAAITQRESTLSPGGVAERYGLNLYQPNLTWNYQPDPSTRLPDHQSALSQSTLYVRPDNKIALTVMSRTDVDEKLVRMAESHCDALQQALRTRGWL